MEKFTTWLKEHYQLTVACLVLVILLQCCGGCSKKQQIAFKDVQIEQVEDSLSVIIDNQKDSISTLNAKIAELTGRNEQLSDANTSLKAANNRPIIIKTETK